MSPLNEAIARVRERQAVTGASAVPIMLPAPGLFSTTICCPRTGVSRSASKRPTMSAPCPGGNGTMIRIGFAGHSCADAAAGSSANARTISRPYVADR